MSVVPGQVWIPPGHGVGGLVFQWGNTIKVVMNAHYYKPVHVLMRLQVLLGSKTLNKLTAPY